MKGINGKILHVDLTKRKITVEQPDEAFYRKYLGGGALGSYYLLKDVPADVDAFSPENVLVFASGLLAGVPCSGLTRFSVVSKSPMTGGFAESEAAGYWGPELKAAGFDAIVIKGKADKPVYLWVHDGEYEIRDASHLWGKEIKESHEAIIEELGDKRIRIAEIGPGAEKLVRYGCIINELRHANGRTGMGAVMGSKNLKAIAVRGKQKREYVDPAKLQEIGKNINKTVRENYGVLKKLGTALNVNPLNSMGMLPTKNFIDGEFDQADGISGEKMTDTILIGEGTCYGCAAFCKREVEVKRDDFTVDPRYGGPEYETIGAFGSACMVGDIEVVSKANEICQRYTIDTISAGMTIAFAMECYEKGLITKEDTGGIELTFGNGKALLQIMEQIVNRQGFGDILAEGSYRAAKKIGKGAEDFSMHVKGQEVALHEPRGKHGLSLSYALSPTGADHLEALPDNKFEKEGGALGATEPLGILNPMPMLDLGPEKLKFFFHSQLMYNVFNSLGICVFIAVPGPLRMELIVEQIKALTGWNTSIWELLKAGERSGIMGRIFNNRCGIAAKDDTLPKRFFEPLEKGVLKGEKMDRDIFEKAVKLYYDMAGIDEQGKVLEGKVVELGLQEFISAN